MFSKGLAIFGLVQLPSSAAYNHGHKASNVPREHVGEALPTETLVAEESVPHAFDWRNVNGNNYVTADWNQHIPTYCGACWIHGTVSALNDRIKVMRNRKFPDIMLGRQTVVNCVTGDDPSAPPPGCNGGDAWMIHKYMHENPHKIGDESCLPYEARNMGCEPVNVCRNCAPNGTCWPVDNYIGYGISSYGKVSGEKAMMKEIYARGPIVCSFATDGNFMYNFSEVAAQNEGVFLTSKRYTAAQVDHDMEVAGWGVTPGGVKYWVVRNSWGTYWGESGWLKLRRGVNELMSESDCAWAVPTWPDLDKSLEGKVLGDYARGDLSTYETLELAKARKIFGEQALASEGGDVRATFDLPSVALAAFVAGVSTTLVAVKVVSRKRVEEQPFFLG